MNGHHDMAIPEPYIQLLSKMKQRRPLSKKTLTLANESDSPALNCTSH